MKGKTKSLADYSKRNYEDEVGPSILLFLQAGTGSIVGAAGRAIVTVRVTTCLSVRLRGESKASFGEKADEEYGESNVPPGETRLATGDMIDEVAGDTSPIAPPGVNGVSTRGEYGL
jgi:hypothetical protein